MELFVIEPTNIFYSSGTTGNPTILIFPGIFVFVSYSSYNSRL